MRKRKGLGEFGIALLHVIEVGYNTPHRCLAENTKGSDSQVLADIQIKEISFNEKRFGKLTHIARPC